MIRTCLFDMGNVLVFFSHDRMCEQLGKLCGRSGPDIRQLLIESGVQWEFERGRMSVSQFHDWFREATRTSISSEELVRAGADIFSPNQPIVPILDQLKQAGVRLVLLSNTCQTHFEWVRDHFDVLDRFDGFVTSYQAGAIKPESAIFQAALDRIDCSPSECFYTDDIEPYVATGRRFGLNAEVFTGVTQLVDQLKALGISINAAP